MCTWTSAQVFGGRPLTSRLNFVWLWQLIEAEYVTAGMEHSWYDGYIWTLWLWQLIEADYVTAGMEHNWYDGYIYVHGRYSMISHFNGVGVVYTAANSFSGVGGLLNSPRSKVKMRIALNAFMFQQKMSVSRLECIWGAEGWVNPLHILLLAPPISCSMIHLKVSVSHQEILCGVHGGPYMYSLLLWGWFIELSVSGIYIYRLGKLTGPQHTACSDNLGVLLCIKA